MNEPLPLKSANLRQNGFELFEINLPKQWEDWVQQKDFPSLDQDIFRATAPLGELFAKLHEFAPFSQIEHILSLRQAPDDEDGIWHDDGSRPMAFSLGLNFSPNEIQGGELLFRKKGTNDQAQSFAPLAWGQGVVFLTGLWGYEHKVTAVTASERLVLAGWCTP